jgi:hypothetical protein
VLKRGPGEGDRLAAIRWDRIEAPFGRRRAKGGDAGLALFESSAMTGSQRRAGQNSPQFSHIYAGPPI